MLLTCSPALWWQRPASPKGGSRSGHTALGPVCQSLCHIGLRHPGWPQPPHTTHSALYCWSPAVVANTAAQWKWLTDVTSQNQAFHLQPSFGKSESIRASLIRSMWVQSVNVLWPFSPIESHETYKLVKERARLEYWLISVPSRTGSIQHNILPWC